MNIAYPLFPVTLITFLAYFTTWIFVRWEILKQKWHRKFWNYLLLITFLISGLLGMLSVVKVNYKLEIPYYETFMQWHVSFGIAMVIIAFFHLWWHLKYYFTFRKSKVKSETIIPEITDIDAFMTRVMLLLLGFITMVNQVVFIREFINVLSGNELVVGIILSVWMLLTGWGALAARKRLPLKFTFQRGMVMLTSLTLFPMLLLALLFGLKSLMFPPGTIVDLNYSILAAIVLLFPVCFLSGHLFTVFSTYNSVSGNVNLTGKSYAFESLGSLAGGVLFSLILGRFFTAFQIFALMAILVLITGVWLDFKFSNHRSWGKLSIGLLIPVLIFTINPDHYIKKLMFPNQQLVLNKSTRYGNLMITKQAGQLNVYENNNLQFYTHNVMMNEEAVHYAMIQHENPRNILLVSGGMAGMIAEIEKYKVDHITYLETNPELFKWLPKYLDTLPQADNVEIVKKDIRRFIAGTDQVYDVILMNLPPPLSLGLNRFYTEEFFKQVKKHCNEKTVICTRLPSTANYAEDNALGAQSSLWKTMGLFFKHQLLITGEKNYFLASDSPLSTSVAEKISAKQIPTDYVNPWYVDDMLIAMRSEGLTSQFSEQVPVNRDFYPYMFVRQIANWMSYFQSHYRLLIIIPLLLFLLFFVRTNRLTAGLYTGGFTGASLEIILLLAYQVFFGSIYLNTALFFAFFMAGLAFGGSKTPWKMLPVLKSYYITQFALAAFALVIPLVIQLMGGITGMVWFVQILFFALIFVLAAGIGYEFMLASELTRKNYSEISGINYSTDLFGSAFGAFLTALVLLPLLGMPVTCMLLAVLNVFSGVLAFSGRKSLNITT